MKEIKLLGYEPRTGEQKYLYALTFASENQEERDHMEDLGANAWIRIAIGTNIILICKR
jgi:hypothetical protein